MRSFNLVRWCSVYIRRHLRRPTWLRCEWHLSEERATVRCCDVDRLSGMARRRRCEWWRCPHRSEYLHAIHTFIVVVIIKGKRTATYIEPQTAHSASSTLCVGDRAGVQPRPQTKPADSTFTCSNVAIICRFDGFHPCNPCKCINYYSFTDLEGMEGWDGQVGWPTTDSLPTKWSPVNHRSGAEQGKSAVSLMQQT